MKSVIYEELVQDIRNIAATRDLSSGDITVLSDASWLIESLQSRIESLEKNAARYQLYKENSHIRFSLFSGRYRADNGHSILTDWMDSFDECFDTAMQATQVSSNAESAE